MTRLNLKLYWGTAKEKGLRQLDIAHNLGITNNYLSMLVSGKFTWTDDMRSRLAKVLDIDVEELFETVEVSP